MYVCMYVCRARTLTGLRTLLGLLFAPMFMYVVYVCMYLWLCVCIYGWTIPEHALTGLRSRLGLLFVSMLVYVVYVCMYL